MSSCQLMLRCSNSRREAFGDQLRIREAGGERASALQPCFYLLRVPFQRNRVEFATSAHEHVLQSYGLLDDVSRLVASKPFKGGNLAQGLVFLMATSQGGGESCGRMLQKQPGCLFFGSALAYSGKGPSSSVLSCPSSSSCRSS